MPCKHKLNCPPLQAAAERLNVFSSGQFLDPLFTGDWSTERLSTMAPSVLPRFTPQQSAALKAAKPDFIALQVHFLLFLLCRCMPGSCVKCGQNGGDAMLSPVLAMLALRCSL